MRPAQIHPPTARRLYPGQTANCLTLLNTPRSRHAAPFFSTVIDCNSSRRTRAGVLPVRDIFAASLTIGHGSAQQTGVRLFRASDIFQAHNESVNLPPLDRIEGYIPRRCAAVEFAA